MKNRKDKKNNDKYTQKQYNFDSCPQHCFVWYSS